MKKYILFTLFTLVALFLAAAGDADNAVAERSSATVTEPVAAEVAAFLPLSGEPLNDHWEFHSRLPDLSGVAGLQLRSQHQSRLHPARFCGDCPAVCRFLRFDAGCRAGFRGDVEGGSSCPVRLAAVIEVRAGPCA